MVYFVIAGKINCPRFAHVSYVADYLEQKLPNFVTKRLALDEHDWPFWLNTINKENNWHHAISPLIYKHLLCFGGESHYIGGISEFWEYCHDYYGIESNLSTEELDTLIQERIKAYEDNLLTNKLETQKARNILIYGPENSLMFVLVPELFKIKGLCPANGLNIFLFHADAITLEEESHENLESFKWYFNCHVQRISMMRTCLPTCDLLLIIQDFNVSLEKQEGLIDMVIKVRYLAEQIYEYGNYNMKIVFANNGFSSFAATILADRVTNPNIAVVTSDRGLPPLSAISRRYNIQMDELAAPPVWGFIGCNEFIDVQSVIKISSIYKPYKRAITSPEGSTLTQGTIVKELKMLKYLIDDPDELMKEVDESYQIITATLNHEPIYQKVRATTKLLELWYSPTPTDAVISLGIISDGSFDLPLGLFFSQPAIFNGDRWVPFGNYPISRQVGRKIKFMAHESLLILKEQNVLPSRYDTESVAENYDDNNEDDSI